MTYQDRFLGGAPPGAATVGVASSIVALACPTRKKIVFVNTSDTAIYMARADAAVLNRGIYLAPFGGSLVDEPDQYGRMYFGNWSAITSAANKVLTISEDR